MSIAVLAFALTSPARRSILEYLQSGSATMGELAAALGMAPSTASHHVDVLRRVGFVETSRVGREVFVETLVGDIELVVASRHGLTTPPDVGGQSE
ncbi:MAG: Bacterial regulatory protein arsR family [Pseudomonadota bacterium]